MSCVNFAQSKQEKFNIPNPPEYPPELFNFSIKRFRRRISTPVVKIIQDRLIVKLNRSGHSGESLEVVFLDFPVPLRQFCVSDILPLCLVEYLSQLQSQVISLFNVGVKFEQDTRSRFLCRSP